MRLVDQGAALVAAEQLAAARDPAACAVLQTIATDEARHAELAWRFVAWALASGDARVRAAVAGAFDRKRLRPDPGGAIVPDAATAGVLAEHGWIDPTARGTAIERALDEVVGPCAQALLAKAPEKRQAVTALR